MTTFHVVASDSSQVLARNALNNCQLLDVASRLFSNGEIQTQLVKAAPFLAPICLFFSTCKAFPGLVWSGLTNPFLPAPLNLPNMIHKFNSANKVIS